MKSPRATEKLARALLFLLAALLVVSGIALLVASSLPFEVLRSRLDAVSTDGSADAFTPALFGHLVLSFRLLAAGLFAAAGLLVLARRRLAGPAARWLDACGSFFGELGRDWREALRREDAAHVCAFLIVLLAAAALRLWFLHQPMRHDESWTFTVFASRPLFVGLSNYSEPNNHLFHTLLVHLAYLALGNKPWVLRLPALAAGILMVPAWYLAVRVLFDKHAGLLAAALVASSSALIEYSTNARGYTLVCLFFALLLALGQRLASRPEGVAWSLFAVLSALGLYTVPVMLYPFGVVVLWMLLSFLRAEGGRSRARCLKQLGLTVAGAGLMTAVLYLPVFVASGVGSVVGNRHIAPLPWPVFVERLPEALGRTWELWNRDLPVGLGVVLALGFAASVVFHKRLASHRLPIVLAVVLWCGPLLLAQRVAPRPKVWLFLLPLYLGLAAAGASYLLKTLAPRLAASPTLACVALALALTGLLGVSVVRAGSIYESNVSDGLEETVLFLKERLAEGDRVVARLPMNAPVGYYFDLHEVPMRYFVADPGSGDRLFVIVNERVQTLEEAMSKARGRIENFGEPVVIARHRHIRLYQLRRTDQKRGAGGPTLLGKETAGGPVGPSRPYGWPYAGPEIVDEQASPG